MIEVSSEQSRSQFYVHTVLLPLLCCSACCNTAAVAAAAGSSSTVPAAVCHRVPDGKYILLCFVDSDPSVSLSSFKRDFFLMYPLADLSHLRPRYAYILGNYGYARSQGGRQPVVAKPRLHTMGMFLVYVRCK